MTERWLPIAGYDGLYEVSDQGRVRSLPRPHCTGRTLAPFPKSTGYLAVTLSRDGKRVQRQVHRLVLESFAGPCPAGQEGRHGPRGQADNRWPENLRWGTPAENQHDRARDNTRSRGERHGNAKLTRLAATEIRRRVAAGETRISVSRDYGISPSSVGRIACGKTWKETAAA